jgi:DNA mismatch repair ATPase MutL
MSSNSTPKTMAVIFKAYMNMLDDTFDTKKEIEEYIKNGLKEIIEAKKAEEKAKKAAKPEPKKKAAKAAKSDDEKEEEKAKKEEEKAKKDAVKAEEKAKKAEEKAKKAEEKAKKAEEKAKKAEEKAGEKAKKTDEEEDSDDSEPKKPVKKAKKEAKAPKAAEIDEEGNVVVKPKKPPTERKIFYDEMRIKVKDMFPDLNPQQTTKKIAELWKVKLARLAEANKVAMDEAMNASSSS